MRGMILPGLFGVALVFFAGCTSPSLPGSRMVQEEFHGVYTLPPGATLHVSNLNGNIAISGSPDQTLVVNAVKSSQYGQAELDKVTIEVQNGTESAIITWVSPPGAMVTVSYEILVPLTVPVIRVDTMNGNIDATGVTGDGTIGSTNGYLHLSDWSGTLSAGTTNGNIEVHNIGNITSLHTTNGPISGTLGYLSGTPAVPAFDQYLELTGDCGGSENYQRECGSFHHERGDPPGRRNTFRRIRDKPSPDRIPWKRGSGAVREHHKR
jgi:hypothetical protein